MFSEKTVKCSNLMSSSLDTYEKYDLLLIYTLSLYVTDVFNLSQQHSEIIDDKAVLL